MQEQIVKRIETIEKRNQRVEMDKAWETSLTRKVVIAVLTYIMIVLFFFTAGLSKPFVNSIVPTVGFALSTFSIPYFKRIWFRRRD